MAAVASRELGIAGVCGRDLSYDICAVEAPPIMGYKLGSSRSSYFLLLGESLVICGAAFGTG